MELVKFSNGKYGIRRGWFLYEYLSIGYAERNENKTDLIWWKKESDHYAEDCMADYEDVKKIFDSLPMRFINKKKRFSY